MKNELQKQSENHGFQIEALAPLDFRSEAFNTLEMPEALRQFYNITNGITHGWFRIPPIYDPNQTKKTWDSIQRLNDPNTSKYLSGETEFLKRFLVFAELSGPDYGVFDKGDGSIWYSEADDMTLKLNLVYEELNNRDKLLQKKKREVTKDLIIVD